MWHRPPRHEVGLRRSLPSREPKADKRNAREEYRDYNQIRPAKISHALVSGSTGVPAMAKGRPLARRVANRVSNNKVLPRISFWLLHLFYNHPVRIRHLKTAKWFVKIDNMSNLQKKRLRPRG
jgi:hypothetical protein